MRVWTSIGLMAFFLVAAFGCVKQSEFDAKVAELDTCGTNLKRCGKTLQEAKIWGATEKQRAQELKANLEAQTDRANRDLADLQKQLDEGTALNASLREELERKGANVDALLKEKGALASSLEQAKARLEELRRAQAAAERRAQMLRQLIDRFRKMADAGQLKVVVRRGRMVIQLPNDVLFDSGRAVVKPVGRTTLAEVAKILGDIQNRQFQIAGHTDTNPIRTARYPSNWYLSTARAIKVLELLIENGMSPRGLSASGYGEFDPIAPNDNDANRAKNRRIEIVIQPNVDELLAVTGTGL